MPGSSWAGLSACNVWLPAPAAEPSSRGKCRNGAFSSDQAGAMHAEAAVQEQFMCPGNQTGRVWFPFGYCLARLSGGRLSQASSERARLRRNEVQVRFPGARLSADFCTGRHESDGDASNNLPSVACAEPGSRCCSQPITHRVHAPSLVRPHTSKQTRPQLPCSVMLHAPRLGGCDDAGWDMRKPNNPLFTLAISPLFKTTTIFQYKQVSSQAVRHSSSSRGGQRTLVIRRRGGTA